MSSKSNETRRTLTPGQRTKLNILHYQLCLKREELVQARSALSEYVQHVGGRDKQGELFDFDASEYEEGIYADIIGDVEDLINS